MTERDARHRALLASHRGGDPGALEALCRSVVPFINWLVSRYSSRLETRADLVGEAWVGFLEGLERYDLAAETSVASYAAIWARCRLTAAITRGLTTREQRRVFYYLYEVEGDLVAEGVDPTDENVAARLDVAPADVRRVRERAVVIEMDDDLSTSEVPGADEVLAAHEERAALMAAVASLPPREREVIERTYLGGETLESCSDGRVSRSRVQQIRDRAIDMLREKMR